MPSPRLPGCSLLLLLLATILLPFAATAGADDVQPPRLTLADALARAETDNLVITAATARLAARQAELSGASAALLPSLSTGYSYTRLKDEPYRIFGSNRVVTGDRDNFHWDLTASQPLFTGFALSTTKKMASLGVDIEALELERAKLQVAKEVKIAYFAILRADRLLTVAREAVDQLSAHVGDAQHFYDQGMIPLNDLLKSQVAMAEAQQKEQQAEATRAKAVAGFNILLRLPMEQATEVADDRQWQPADTPLAPLVDEALAHRPEVLAMRLSHQRADQAVRLTASGLYPQVNLIGRYQRDTEDGDLETNDYTNPDNTSVMVEARWKLFDWGQRRAEINRSHSEVAVLAARLAGLEDTVRLEVKNAFLDRQLAEANITTAASALGQARENFRLTRLQYRESLVSSTDVIDARTMVTRTESNSINARYGYRIADAELDRALGRMPGASTDADQPSANMPQGAQSVQALGTATGEEE